MSHTRRTRHSKKRSLSPDREHSPEQKASLMDDRETPMDVAPRPKKRQRKKRPKSRSTSRSQSYSPIRATNSRPSQVIAVRRPSAIAVPVPLPVATSSNAGASLTSVSEAVDEPNAPRNTAKVQLFAHISSDFMNKRELKQWGRVTGPSPRGLGLAITYGVAKWGREQNAGDVQTVVRYTGKPPKLSACCSDLPDLHSMTNIC